MGRPRARNRLGEAIHLTREASGLTQDDIALALDVSQPTFSDWEGTPQEVTEWLDRIAKIEDACRVPRGTILRRAGYAAPGGDVPAAIDDDEKLDAESKRLILSYYEFVRNRSAESHR